MRISIEGTTEDKAEAFEEAIKFLSIELLGKRMARGLTIDLEICKRLDVDGECINEDSTKRSRWFTIRLKDRIIGKMIETLAHELVHVKQHVRNELGKKHLVFCRGGDLKIETEWKGAIWQPKGNEDHYYDAPWEQEAFGMERGLAFRFQKHWNKLKG